MCLECLDWIFPPPVYVVVVSQVRERIHRLMSTSTGTSFWVKIYAQELLEKIFFVFGSFRPPRTAIHSTELGEGPTFGIFE